MQNNQKKKIAIVGGGVVGLTSALVLSSEYDVTIIAEKVGVKSDSWKATAIWHVYLVPETEEILSWAQYSLEVLCKLSITDKTSSVELVKGVELFRNSEPTFPSWSHIPPLFKMLSENEITEYNNYNNRELTTAEIFSLQSKPIKWGYHIEAPTADMNIYLLWLQSKVVASGVKIIEKKLNNLNELSDSYDLIINCSGFGARELADDTNFEVYKGQYFILKGGDTAPTVYVGDDDHPLGMAYMIPRAGEIMIGGSAEKNVEDLELTLELDDTIKRAGLYVPWLRTCSSADQARQPVVGIRPCRTTGVRLELDKTSFKIPVIHNYGHGGSGFSLCWGCAEAVKKLIAETEKPTHTKIHS